MKDPYFEGIDFEKLMRRETPPPKLIKSEGDQDSEDEDKLTVPAVINIYSLFYLYFQKPIFKDYDYTEQNQRTNRVINFTFTRDNEDDQDSDDNEGPKEEAKKD